jgi:pimeloyl-ACP methyl ester carboxylesterase
VLFSGQRPGPRAQRPITSVVILVHGLWMSGFALDVLKRRLESSGEFRAVSFTYPSVTGSMSEHVRRLIDLARAQQAGQVHFVGHSLGGVVVFQALRSTDDLPPGRAVLMGPPLQGCRAATSVARVRVGRTILGAAINEEVIDCAPRVWSGHRDIGVIAGSMGVGLGRLFGNLTGPHDGTILVDETRLPGAKDHIVLRTSHTGMLLSPEVARQAKHFLSEGKFAGSS